MLLAWLEQPWLYATTVTLYFSPQSSAENWHVEPAEVQLYTCFPDVFTAFAAYSSTSDLSSQDTTAIPEPHCRSTATC